MMSISHWGMFDAKVVPYRFFPLVWANDIDEEFDQAEAWSTILGEKIDAVYNGIPIRSAGEMATLAALRNPIKFPWDEEKPNGHA